MKFTLSTPSNPSQAGGAPSPFNESLLILGYQIAAALVVMALSLVCFNFYNDVSLQPVCVPVTGLALAALLIDRKYLVPGLFAGLLLARVLLNPDPVWASVLVVAGNAAEVLLASRLLRNYHFSAKGLDTAYNFGVLCLVALVSPMASSTMLVIAQALNPQVSASVTLAAVNSYWLADTVSTIQIVCVTLLWIPLVGKRSQGQAWLELGVAMVGSLLVGQIVFFEWMHEAFGAIGNGYWLFLIVLAIALRVGCHGVAAVLLLVTAQALEGAAHGLGFFAADVQRTHLVNLWCYLGVLTVVGMSFSIVLRSRIVNEARLRASEEQLLEAQRLASLAVWSWDVETDTHYWSPWIYEFYGRDPSLGPAPYPDSRAYFTEASWARINEGVKECLKSGARYECEAEVIRPDGARRWIIVRGEGKRNQEGKVIGLVGTLQDITTRKTAQLRLASSESNFRALFENSPTAKLALDPTSGKILQANQNASKLWGYTQREMVELSMLDITFPEDRLVSQHRLAAIHAGDLAGNVHFEKRYLRKDGSNFWAEVAITVVRDENNRVLFNIASIIDTTERRRIESQISQLTMTVEQSPESIVITDTNAIIEYVNESYVRTSGYSREELVGNNSRMLQSGKTPHSTFVSLWQKLTNGESWEGEFINRTKDGTDYIEHAIISPIRNADGLITHFAGVKENITEKVRSRNQLHRLAYFDPVTELPNLLMLRDHIGKALEQSAQFGTFCALISLNIDRFKTVTDANGPGFGDRLLKLIAERLVQNMYAADVVARVSGDEFCLLVADLDSTLQPAALRAMEVSQKIHAAMRRPLLLDNREYVLTACHGIALFAGDEEVSANEIVRRANTAMHHAKSRGYEQSVFFDKNLEQLVRRRLDVEGELRVAVRDSQLRVFLQSQVDRDGVIQGAEALVRWQHPENGLIAPGRFIPIAEESNLIVDIDNWMLAEVCKRIAVLPQLPIRVSVNISARHFNQIDFVEQVRHILSQSGANPARLTLEITEGVVIGNLDDVIVKMQALGALGMHFSMDDFGTGYSSLSYLKRLPIHELKIDRSFIQEVTSDPNDAALVEGILAVTRHLKLRVVAEGVETTGQAQFLNERATVLHQGYLFGRPEPFDEWMAKYPMPPVQTSYQYSRRFLNKPPGPDVH